MSCRGQSSFERGTATSRQQAAPEALSRGEGVNKLTGLFQIVGVSKTQLKNCFLQNNVPTKQSGTGMSRGWLPHNLLDKPH